MGRYVPGDNIPPNQSEFGIATSLSDEAKPRVAYGLASDQFLVVWQEEDTGVASFIKGGYLSSTGSITYVNISSGTQVCYIPNIAYNLARNEYLVVWNVSTIGTLMDIYAVRLDDEGNQLTRAY